jgi:hypothetical protein
MVGSGKHWDDVSWREVWTDRRDCWSVLNFSVSYKLKGLGLFTSSWNELEFEITRIKPDGELIVPEDRMRLVITSDQRKNSLKLHLKIAQAIKPCNR